MLFKNVWESKTFWLNLITMLIAILVLLMKQPLIPPEWLPFMLLAVGILNEILRIWFTDTGIASKRAQAARAAAVK